MQDQNVGDILAPHVPKPPAPTVADALDVPVAPEPVKYRAFDDAPATREALNSNILKAIQGRYPVENQRHRLMLENVKWVGPDRFATSEQKRAIMRGESLDRRLEGEWVLTDKETGTEMDRRKATVAHVPFLTNRGTFIYRGNEYTVGNQMRLKPGVYTRVKDNGILEAHVNVRPGTGPSFRVYMEPDTGIFRLGLGQSTLKLYPILKSMGVSDKQLEKSWGRDLLQKNIEAEDPRAVARAFNKLIRTVPTQDEEDEENEAKNVGGEMQKAAKRPPTVAVDLDGTLAKMYDKFDPKRIEDPRPGARKAMKEWQRKGYRVIINTVRGDVDLVKEWLVKHDIPYDYINENPDQPSDASDKVLADVYVDDRAIDAKPAWKNVEEAVQDILAKEEE